MKVDKKLKLEYQQGAYIQVKKTVDDAACGLVGLCAVLEVLVCAALAAS